MLTPQEIENRLALILPTVDAPGRYNGGEFNQVVKNWDNVQTKVALLFPEIYDLAMSNLGIMILYDLINQRPHTLAERVFLPWVDMEKAMRQAEIPLYSLETKHALADFDLIGVSLPYESLYTNLLNALDLGGIPLLSADRTSGHPLIIAGGHATFNPEPVAAYVDAFVIGEGEEVIHEIVDCVEAFKHSNVKTLEREKLLLALAQIPGVYVPALYQAHYHTNGVFSHLEPLSNDVPQTIIKRIVGELPPPPTRFIVPYIDTVHNRAPIEIMRGCTRGCRFCHAGIVNRPVRERSVEQILTAIEEIIPHTGYSEVGLLSLSSSDYSHVVELVKAINERFQGKNIAISLPSLRIESLSVKLMDALAGQRRRGFTLAPEAATERMRQTINKPISDAQLLETVREIYSRGWHTIKLYFMIGLPTETLEDVQAIAELSKAVRDEGAKIIGKRAQVHVSIGTFIPKPHTPFQWVACDTIEIIQNKLNRLKEELRGWGLKMNWNDPRETTHEAWLTRGDRRMAKVIYHAWKNGAKFDAWREHFNFQAWIDAFEEVSLNPDFYTHRQRSADEVFPWDHINAGVSKKFLRQDYEWSQEEKTRPDCREKCYACGILPTFNDLRRQVPDEAWYCPAVK
ncbi:MAG: TIGR03960 family B12-binding radical SAM protein [Chloroflexota bacterium]|nr:MAG: TIGR03960 family B12-binding radical SAM protein [Chloroflexota bacterium]